MTFVIEKLVLTKLISFLMFKDGQAIIIQIWMLICENNCQTIVSVIREHPNLGDRVRIRWGRRILFSADNSFGIAPQRIETRRIGSDALASFHLKYITSCRIGVSRPWELHTSKTLLSRQFESYFPKVDSSYVGV